MTTLHLKRSIGRSPMRLAFLLIPLALAIFTLPVHAQTSRRVDIEGVPVDAFVPLPRICGAPDMAVQISGKFDFLILDFAVDQNMASGYEAVLGEPRLS